MQLLGRTDGLDVVASIAHYDCRTHNGMLVDGGQPHCFDYPGYNRFGGDGKTIWFELPQTYEELYNDYALNKPRKFGVWKMEDVTIIDPPDVEDVDFQMEHVLWGTRGKSGKEPLRYVALKNCELEHLQNIIDTQWGLSERMEVAIKYWINKKS